MQEAEALDLAKLLCREGDSIPQCLDRLKQQEKLFTYTITNHENTGITVIRSNFGVLRIADLAYENANRQKGQYLTDLMTVILQEIY